MMKSLNFTIIELLISIAILALLMSLLQPTISKMHEQTRLHICQSNLKTQYIAVTFYTEDHLTLPYGHQWFGGLYNWEPERQLHHSTSWNYIGDVEQYICPTFRMVNDNLSNRNPVRSFSYGLNWLASRTGKNFFDFQHPSQMALITEENPFVMNGVYRHAFNDGFVWIGGWNPIHVDGIATFHKASNYNIPEPIDGFADVLFIDGHVDLGDINQLNEIMRDIPLSN